MIAVSSFAEMHLKGDKRRRRWLLATARRMAFDHRYRSLDMGVFAAVRAVMSVCHFSRQYFLIAKTPAVGGRACSPDTAPGRSVL